MPLQSEPIIHSKVAHHNFIDTEVNTALERLRLEASPQSDDATFLRRVSLDLTGRLPTPDQIRAFVGDGRKDKRSRLIDSLLDGDSFNDFWTMKLAQLFQINSKKLQKEGALAFHSWLKQQLKKKASMNQVVHSLLTTTGDSYQNGSANFSRVGGGARPQAEYVSRVFMGVRLRCANCHNHPLDRWTQDDYHGFAAIFAKVKRGRVVGISNRGEVTHPYTGQPAAQRLPGKRFLVDGEDGRLQVAKWLTDSANPYFARSMVNRLWRSMMGRGLVEPVDDLRSTNPPTHPQLLDALTADFVKHDYDLRHTLRTIANSAAYQRSSAAANGNEVDQSFYSHAIVRSLDAEVIADALADATGVGQDFSGARPGTRAVQLFDPLTPSVALDVLGRCSRDEPCESSMAAAGIAQALHLINGTLINQKVASKDGALRKMLSRPDREVVNELYLRALGRSALEKELKRWLAEVKAGKRREVFEDLFWSLLSSQQFMTNH